MLLTDITKLKNEIQEKQYLLDFIESVQVMNKLQFKDMHIYKQRQRDQHYWLAEVRFRIRNWDTESRIRVSLGNVDKVDPKDPEVQAEAVREAKKLWNKKLSKIYPEFLK